APVLERSRLPRGEAAWSLPLRALGAEAAQLSVRGGALDADPGSRGDLIPNSVKFQTYALGRSHEEGGMRKCPERTSPSWRRSRRRPGMRTRRPLCGEANRGAFHGLSSERPPADGTPPLEVEARLEPRA